ncbi:hypothetical protein [Haploplasma axanthum]|nr:hypothetical protein [Haploplasma axanthum]
MKEIEKYKRRVSLFRKTGVPSLIIVMLLFIIIILRDDAFGLDDIIITSLFFVISVLIIIGFIYFDRYRYKLIDKYYGKVTSKDQELATKLFNQINLINENEYNFLDSPYFQEYEINLKILLRQIMKKHKVYNKLFSLYVGVKEEILKLDDNERNKYDSYNNYLFELVDLFLRNQSEI